MNNAPINTQPNEAGKTTPAQQFNDLLAEYARRQVLEIFKQGRPPKKEPKFKGGYNAKR